VSSSEGTAGEGLGLGLTCVGEGGRGSSSDTVSPVDVFDDGDCFVGVFFGLSKARRFCADCGVPGRDSGALRASLVTT